MYIYYDKETLEVRIFGDNKLEAKGLNYISKTLSKAEKEKFFDNKNRRQVINGKLVITEPVVEESLEDRIKVIEDSIKEAKLNFNK